MIIHKHQRYINIHKKFMEKLKVEIPTYLYIKTLNKLNSHFIL
jgi:hypothetical protein